MIAITILPFKMFGKRDYVLLIKRNGRGDKIKGVTLAIVRLRL